MSVFKIILIQFATVTVTVLSQLPPPPPPKYFKLELQWIQNFKCHFRRSLEEIFVGIVTVMAKYYCCHHHINYSLISSKGSFICTIPHIRLHTPQPLCYASRGALAGNEKWLNGSTMMDRSNNPLHHEQMFYHGATSQFIINFMIYNILFLFNFFLN